VSWYDGLPPFDPLVTYGPGEAGLIFDVERFAINDGGGIRTLVFLKGCPLHCIWCANPESMVRQPEIVYLRHNCIGCHKCLTACPVDAIHLAADGAPEIDRTQCDLCARCTLGCYAGALNVAGRYVTIPQLMAVVERDRPFYERSGGGITFSGGEPTAQAAFLEAALREAQKRNLHTAIETCGFVSWDTFEPILRFVDLVLYDIKHMDSDEHRRLTGVPNELILANLERIRTLGLPVRVRVPLVPGCNDSPDNIRATAALVASMPNVQGLDILPYHRLGEPKWNELDRVYELHGVLPPTREHVAGLADVARSYGISVAIGG
jgi:pyruvate formate lyase activating enzyme